MKKDVPKYMKSIIKNLRKGQTRAEEILWEELRKNKLKGYSFRRQYPIGRYVVDFYCCKAKLAIELDGEIHDYIENIKYDKNREVEIQARDIKMIRFRNKQITTDLESVLRSICNALEEKD